MLTALEGKLIAQGGKEKQAYGDYATWCSVSSKTKANAIKTAEGQKDLLMATIAKASSDGKDAAVKVAKLIKDIAIDEKKLKTTAAMRKAERTDSRPPSRRLPLPSQ